jgi:hypothetical protein
MNENKMRELYNYTIDKMIDGRIFDIDSDSKDEQAVSFVSDLMDEREMLKNICKRFDIKPLNKDDITLGMTIYDALCDCELLITNVLSERLLMFDTIECDFFAKNVKSKTPAYLEFEPNRFYEVKKHM